jgi:hypothetical protein
VGVVAGLIYVPKTHFHRISIDTYLQIGISWFVIVLPAITLLSYCSRFTATWSIMSTRAEAADKRSTSDQEFLSFANNRLTEVTSPWE